MALSVPDPFLEVPPGFPRIVIFAMFFVAIVGSTWVMLDTRRAMIWMASRAPEGWPGRATTIQLAEKPVVVWLYRIDCAVVFVGAVLILIEHLLGH